MTSHELAQKLLELPELPVATHANNHTFISMSHGFPPGAIRIGKLDSYAGDHIIIGNMSKRNLGKPNHFVIEMYEGDAPEEWPS